MSERICVALDTHEPTRALDIARKVSEQVGVLKVGLTLSTAAGPGLVRDLAEIKPVFLDLKFHDIPAQVSGAVRAAASTGASYTTVHAAGGPEMLRAAVDACGDGMIVLAVTVLTSMDELDLAAIGMNGPPEDAVLRLADLALSCGVPGLVCSPQEVAPIRARFGANGHGGPLLVVPGVRPADGERHDQRRTMTPREAIDAGADVLVIGRPITDAPDPAAAAAALSEQVAT